MESYRPLEVGTKVRININYLREFLVHGEFETHEQFNVLGTVVKMYLVENVDFYEVLWNDGKTEPGFNREFLLEIYDVNVLMKELL